MKGLFTFLILNILNIVFTYSNQKVDDKIITDLIGQSVQTSNENISWVFKNDDHIGYIIESYRNMGIKDFSRYEYLIYVSTWHKKGQDDEFLRAEGNLKLTFKKSQSRNHFYLSMIEQSGFQVFNISKSDKELLENLEHFWLDFQRAIDFDDREKASEMFNYPFEGEFLGNFANKAELMKNYDKFFIDDVKKAIKNSIMIPKKKSKGKDFNYLNDDYVQIFNYDSNIKRENYNNFFVVRIVNGNFKIIKVIEVREY
jgi:hypothetical protein